MPPEALEVYLRRAKGFYDAMSLLDEPEYADAAALLAIHSAISNSDALRLGLGSPKLEADDHGAAADTLLKLLRTRGFDDLSGIPNLRYLLSRKSAVAYGAKRMDAKEVRKITQGAERFNRWATRSGEKLNIEGWRYAHD